jgi:Peptidase family S41
VHYSASLRACRPQAIVVLFWRVISMKFPAFAPTLARDALPVAALGRAHALIRYFGVEPVVRTSDQQLADTLEEVAPESSTALTLYAANARSVCAAHAESAELGAASVVMEGSVAIVSPGASALPSIPEHATAVALDLRNVPETDDARSAVALAIDAIVSGSIVGPKLEQRICNGQPDEVNRLVGRAVDQYACTLTTTKTVAFGNGRKLPLAVLTAPRMTPLATRIAIELRYAAGAFIVGEHLATEIAESHWVGVGQAGVAVRTSRLLDESGNALPDTILADKRTLDPRNALTLIQPTDWAPISNRIGDARAALLVAYGAIYTFFPYLEETRQHGTDRFAARLSECVLNIEGRSSPQRFLNHAPDRAAVRTALRHFAELLSDGHAWLYDNGTMESIEAPVALVPARSAFLVAASTVPEMQPGDEVLSVDNVPVATAVNRAAQLESGSPQAVRARIAARLLQASSVVSVRSTNRRVHTVTIASRAATTATAKPTGERAPGRLHDLRAPEIAYISLDANGAHAPSQANLAAIQSVIDGSRGVILDMRGYPARFAWAVLAYVLPETARGPEMTERLVGPAFKGFASPDAAQTIAMWTSEKQGYTGPVAVLTSATTQSQAEHLLSFFRSAQRGKLIGSPTSGANGTITGVQLPGGYGLTFTGMRVRHPDGSRFHALGHIPDLAVEPTAADLQQGRDTVLRAAITELQREHPLGK